MTAETRKEMPRSEAARGVSPLAAMVRRHDRDRYQTVLFAAAGRREALFALYAFNYEVARVREAVTQPMLGQIRLQWWREAVDQAFSGATPRRHDVAEPLAALIRNFAPSRDCFDRLIDARERDLSDEPPASMAELEDYAEASSATLVRLALEILGGRGAAAVEAARGVGVGYALSGLLRAMPFHARAGRCYIPADIAQRAALDPQDYAAARATPALRAAVTEIAADAHLHLAAARRTRAAVPRGATAALLPAVVADRYLRRLRQAGYDPFAPVLGMPDGLQIIRLAAAALAKRF